MHFNTLGKNVFRFCLFMKFHIKIVIPIIKTKSLLHEDLLILSEKKNYQTKPNKINTTGNKAFPNALLTLNKYSNMLFFRMSIVGSISLRIPCLNTYFKGICLVISMSRPSVLHESIHSWDLLPRSTGASTTRERINGFLLLVRI